MQVFIRCSDVYVERNALIPFAFSDGNDKAKIIHRKIGSNNFQ